MVVEAGPSGTQPKPSASSISSSYHASPSKSSSKRAGRSSEKKHDASPMTRPVPSVKGKERDSSGSTSSPMAAISVAGLSGLMSTPTQSALRRQRKVVKSAKSQLAGSSSLVDDAAPLVDLDDASDEDVEPADDWEIRHLIESTDMSLPVVFSRDRRFFFKPRGSSLLIYSASSPHALVSTLASHTDSITALQLHPSNANQILTTSTDGTLKIWDWTDASLIRTIDLGSVALERDSHGKNRKRKRSFRSRKISKMVSGLYQGKPAAWVVLTSEGKIDASDSSSRVHELYRVSLRHRSQSSSDENSASHAGIAKIANLPRHCTTLALSPRNAFLLLTTSSDAFALTLSTGAWMRISTGTAPITAAAWCPVDSPDMPALLRGRDVEWFATADSKGQIKLWQGFQEAAAAAASDNSAAEQSRTSVLAEMPVCTLPSSTLHWHAHAVSGIAFTSSGAQLLSVGEESVLVTWQIESMRPAFLPRIRIGGGIASISVRPSGVAGESEEYWMGMNDGTTVRVDHSSKVHEVGKTARFAEAPASVANGRGTNLLAYHTPTRSIVLPSSHPSLLQFYQPSSNSVLFDLEVSPSNHVSRKDDFPLEPVLVEAVSFSDPDSDGVVEWMATSERRDGTIEAGGGKQRAVKIWRWDNGTYILNTHLNRAHDLADVTSMKFTQLTTGTLSQQPQILLLTTATDGSAKVWAIKRGKLISSQGGPGKKPFQDVTAYWSLRSSFHHRRLPVVSADVSSDGSLIALAHGSVVSLWNTASNVLLRVLDTADLAQIKRISFIGGADRWLVAAGAPQGLAVWDLISCEVAWSLPLLPITQLVSSSDHFYVSSSQGHNGSTRLTAFSPTSSEPVHNANVPDVFVNLLVPNPSRDSPSKESLLGINATGRPLRVGRDLADYRDVIRSETADEGQQGVHHEAHAHASVWEEMFGKNVFLDLQSKATDLQKTETLATANSSQEKTSKYSSVFDGPAHALPATRLLFESFVEDFISLSTANDDENEDDSGRTRPTGTTVPQIQSESIVVGSESTSANGAANSGEVANLATGNTAALQAKVDVDKWIDWFKKHVSLSSSSTADQQPRDVTFSKGATNQDALATSTLANSKKTSRKERRDRHAGDAVQSQSETLTDAASQAQPISQSPVQVGKKRKNVA